ncbi:hypothetical protein PN498_06400 [Oscillatoria sp. CS-180]|nr:hypothetical protein [Oscillatoria sp. CS-180]
MKHRKLAFRYGLKTAIVGVGVMLASASPVMSSTDKVSQCNALAGVVNQAQAFMPVFESSLQTFIDDAEQVETLDDIKMAASDYVTAVDELVINLDTLAIELETVQLEDSQLIDYRSQYITLMEGLSGTLSDASDAMRIMQDVESEVDLPVKIEESQQLTNDAIQRMQDLSNQEATLISETNAYCGATGQ